MGFKKFLTFCLLLTTLATAEQTLAIIKPDAVRNQHIGDILQRYESEGLKIVGLKMMKLSKEQAEAFYAVHKERPFYKDLTLFMSSGPIVAIVLEGPNAIAKNREIMGATDLNKAAPNTLRKLYATNLTENALHGSDSADSARSEIDLLFPSEQVFK